MTHGASGAGGSGAREAGDSQTGGRAPRSGGAAPETGGSLAGAARDPYDNEVTRRIAAHVSARHYRDEPVPEEAVRRMIELGMRAATSSNMQLTSAVVVRDVDRKAEIARLCGDQQHILDAPVFIAWCADRRRLDRVAERAGYPQVTGYVENFLVAAVDVALSMQNAALAAESFGLGICYIGGLRNDTAAVIELLELPRLVFPIAGMTVGYPAKARPPRPRLDPAAVIHHERYEDVADDLLADYDRRMAETGIYRGRMEPHPDAREITEADYGWIEHTARRASKPSRTDLRQVLERQGYLLR